MPFVRNSSRAALFFSTRSPYTGVDRFLALKAFIWWNGPRNGFINSHNIPFTILVKIRTSISDDIYSADSHFYLEPEKRYTFSEQQTGYVYVKKKWCLGKRGDIIHLTWRLGTRSISSDLYYLLLTLLQYPRSWMLIWIILSKYPCPQSSRPEKCFDQKEAKYIPIE